MKNAKCKMHAPKWPAVFHSTFFTLHSAFRWCPQPDWLPKPCNMDAPSGLLAITSGSLTSNLEFRTLPLCALSYGDGEAADSKKLYRYLPGLRVRPR